MDDYLSVTRVLPAAPLCHKPWHRPKQGSLPSSPTSPLGWLPSPNLEAPMTAANGTSHWANLGLAGRFRP